MSLIQFTPPMNKLWLEIKKNKSHRKSAVEKNDELFMQGECRFSGFLIAKIS